MRYSECPYESQINGNNGSTSGHECLHGNGSLEAWVQGHYEALDYVSKN